MGKRRCPPDPRGGAQDLDFIGYIRVWPMREIGHLQQRHACVQTPPSQLLLAPMTSRMSSNGARTGCKRCNGALAARAPGDPSPSPTMLLFPRPRVMAIARRRVILNHWVPGNAHRPSPTNLPESIPSGTALSRLTFRIRSVTCAATTAALRMLNHRY